jgi:hypothetical protein
MTRSLRVALLGWSLGFLVAGLWGLTQTVNHRLASALFVPAGAGLVVLGVLLVADARRGRRWMSLDDVDGPEFIPAGLGMVWSPDKAAADVAAAAAAATATAAADAAAARIAELEARLALEQLELDNVMHVLAETESVVPTTEESAAVLRAVDPADAEMEPLLRHEVLETLVELVGRKEDVFREFEALTTSGHSSVHPVERPVAAEQGVASEQPVAPEEPVASEENQPKPVRRRRRRAKPKGPVDERAERVGKKDLRRGRARHPQQVGRADEDG